MAITITTDLVLDVARAADPAVKAAAVKRLDQLGSSSAADAFSEDLGAFALRGGTVSHIGPSAESIARAMSNQTVLRGSPMSPMQQFEALVLQQMVETMLPDDAQAVFGEGTAGSIWKSFLAEEIGKQIAQAGGIGLADAIDRTRTGVTDERS